MTMFCLEMRSTQDWDDVRYRAYTTQEARAERFKRVPRIDFTDSGHGIVPVVREHTGRRLPCIWILQDHVDPVLNLPDRSGPTWKQLKKQRDELLEALKKAEEWLDGWASAEPYISVIREAIARAEGH